MTTVHNKKTEFMLPGDILIDRNTDLGNPFHIGPGRHRATVIAQYEEYARWRMEKDAYFRDLIKACYGRRLFCNCAPKPCHGDVVAKLAAELVAKDKNNAEQEAGL